MLHRLPHVVKTCISSSVLKFRSFYLNPMANSRFEYVKSYEQQEVLQKNCWIVIRIDGKGFHKFCDVHKFVKPNDDRALNLMNIAAVAVMQEFNEIVVGYGQSDEYSFIFRRDASVYERRRDKLISYVASLFTSAYIFNWRYIFKDTLELKYPPVFDSRAVLYPTDRDLRDYLSWRQADVHINNLYNTTFWNLVASGKTNAEAEEKLRGTFSSDKNEILFKDFNINYNNEPIMFRKGTTLLRKRVAVSDTQKLSLVVPIFEDMIGDNFWKLHTEILNKKSKPEELYNLGDDMNHVIVQYQIEKHNKRKQGMVKPTCCFRQILEEEINSFKLKMVMWIYTSIIRPKITYASLVWWPKTKEATAQTKLAKLQRLACIAITGAMRSTPTKALDAILNLLPLHEYVQLEAERSALRLKRYKRMLPGNLISGHLSILNYFRGPVFNMNRDWMKPTENYDIPYKLCETSRTDWEVGGPEVTIKL